MLLVEITIGGVPYNISNYALSLEHFWAPDVISCSEIKYGLNKRIGSMCTGGMVVPTYGEINIIPSLFTTYGNYPISCPIKIMYTESDEASAILLFVGNAHLHNITRNGIVYDLHASQPNYKVNAAYLISDNLDNVFSTLRTSLGIANINIDHARALSPVVYYVTNKSNQLFIDIYSDVANFFSHFFYIDTITDTLHLVDMLKDNGEETLTEFDFSAAKYTFGVPPKEVIIDDEVAYSPYVYGRTYNINPVCSIDEVDPVVDNSTIRQISAENIKSILIKPGVELPMPIGSIDVVIGKKLSWVDESLEIPINVSMNVREVTYNFDIGKMILVGEGDISQVL